MSDLLSKLSQNPKLISTPDGAYTLKEDNRYIHSSRAPLKEAQKLLQNIPPDYPKDKTLIIAWGTGLGYHIEILLNQGFKVLAIETRPESARLFEENFPIENLVGFVSGDESGLFDIMANLDSKEYQLFIDIAMLGFSVSPILYEESQQGKRVLRSIHGLYSRAMEAWYYNIINNLSLPITYTDDAIFEGEHLLICSAGPSLKESIPFLKKYQDKFTIMAVDTAFTTLVQGGIIPDYIHSVDTKIHNIADFRGVSHDIISQITLIIDISLNAQVTMLPWKKVLYTSTSHLIKIEEIEIYKRIHILQYLWDNGIKFPEVQTGGSVATSAFYLGLLYKAKKIYLVGQDLAYSQHRGHAIGSPYDMEYRLQASRLSPIDTIHIHKIPFEYSVDSLDGTHTYTDPLLSQYREWFEISLKNNTHLKTKTVNASESGAYFKYWDNTPLSAMRDLDTLPKKSLKEFQIKSYTKDEILVIMAQLEKIVFDLESSNPLVEEFFYRELQNPLLEDFRITNKKNKIKKVLRHAQAQISSS